MHEVQGKQPTPVQTQPSTVLSQEEARQLSQISLWLDDYNDIFSDFDPRPYSERALSVDFIDEAQRAARDKPSGQIILKLLVPENKRSLNEEAIIKKRIKDHFRKRVTSGKQDINKLVKQGAIFTFIGTVLMLFAAFILYKYPESSVITSLLIVFFEPAGWFFFWEGLGLIIFETKKLRPVFEFNEKMYKCDVTFISY